MPVRRLWLFLAAASVAVLLVPALASAAPRMYVGFHDDPNFRFGPNRATALNQARSANATVVRTLVTWASVAPRRPRNAVNPFDPAYRFDDLDEFVRNAQVRGMEVLITLWGTPKWANGNKTPNFAPTRATDFRNFARAVATRYNGRRAGFPFVKFYSIWNESNHQLFLAPQFDARGKPVGPRTYARIASAAYAGIKAGNPRALVALGSTASHGRDKPLKGRSATISPGRFAQLVAAASPRIRFDAWAHHPYPTPQNLKPTQKVKWPNVTLSSLPRFKTSLDKWFKRKGIRLWLTEYGYETKEDGERKGVTRAQQAAYANQVLRLARNDARIDMFIWFVFRDNPSSLWQSGLLTRTGRVKPALSRFRSMAGVVDARNALIRVRGGTNGPMVTIPLREYGHGTAAGERVGFNFGVFQRGRLVTRSQTSALFGIDAASRIRLTGFRPVKGRTYTVNVEANVFSGGGLVIKRTLTVVGV
jgi:hypothetical protein